VQNCRPHRVLAHAVPLTTVVFSILALLVLPLSFLGTSSAVASPPSGGLFAGGGVSGYGQAATYGSFSGVTLASPAVGMAPTPSGNGYWVTAADGGVFNYGGAGFHGSAGGQNLVAPVTGIAALADGSGYYLVAADGGVFAYNAPFFGSAAGVANGVVMGITAGSGGGYTLATDVGGAFAYGATYFGNQNNSGVVDPVVSIAS